MTGEEERDTIARQIAAWYATPIVADVTHERRVIAAAMARPPGERRRPRWIATGFAAAALVVGAAIVHARSRAAETQSAGTVAVRFVFRGAASAARVTLVGDFNDWNATVTPLRRTPSGTGWIVDVHVAPGRYGYAFVVDGHEWIADPTAPLAPDAFGHPTSVLVVGADGAA
jgi:hypothetical protein